MKSKTIAVANQKGGVGKSTTSINLAAGLVQYHNKKVLLIDLDPQGNTTKGLGVSIKDDQYTIADLLCSEELEVPIQSVICSTYLPNLSIIPSDISLALAEMKLSTMCAREFKLRQRLSELEYDFIIIDCPPTFTTLTINAFSTADDILMPVKLSFFSMEGVNGFIEALNFVNNQISPVIKHRISLKHVLINFYDSRLKMASQILDKMKDIFNEEMFETKIPINNKLDEAQSNGIAIYQYDNKCTGFEAYKSFTNEFVKRYSNG